MPGIKQDKKISDMTAAEFKALVKESVLDALDPDSGLELRTEVMAELRESLRQSRAGEGVPLDEVKKRLGLK